MCISSGFHANGRNQAASREGGGAAGVAARQSAGGIGVPGTSAGMRETLNAPAHCRPGQTKDNTS